MVSGNGEHSGREIRLLLLVIAVAVAVLLVLARFRFPEAEIVGVSPTPNPLERIAARAPFEDLTSAVAEAASKLVPQLMTVEFGPPPEEPAKGNRKGGRANGPAPAPRRFVPGLRVRPDLVLVSMPTGLVPVSAGGHPALLAAADVDRQVGLVSVINPGVQPDFGAAVADLAAGLAGFKGGNYVVVAEAGPGAPVFRPAYIAAADLAAVERWSAPLLRIGGAPQAQPGAFLFGLDGRLIGLAIDQPDGLAIADAATLNGIVSTLASARQ